MITRHLIATTSGSVRRYNFNTVPLVTAQLLRSPLSRTSARSFHGNDEQRLHNNKQQHLHHPRQLTTSTDSVKLRFDSGVQKNLKRLIKENRFYASMSASRQKTSSDVATTGGTISRKKINTAATDSPIPTSIDTTDDSSSNNSSSQSQGVTSATDKTSAPAAQTKPKSKREERLRKKDTLKKKTDSAIDKRIGNLWPGASTSTTSSSSESQGNVVKSEVHATESASEVHGAIDSLFNNCASASKKKGKSPAKSSSIANLHLSPQHDDGSVAPLFQAFDPSKLERLDRDDLEELAEKMGLFTISAQHDRAELNEDDSTEDIEGGQLGYASMWPVIRQMLVKYDRESAAMFDDGAEEDPFDQLGHVTQKDMKQALDSFENDSL